MSNPEPGLEAAPGARPRNARPDASARAAEGYLLLAVERQRYFDISCALARSIRLFDPSRPIAIAVDPSIVMDRREALFDRVIVLEPAPGYVGVLHKLRLFEINPFERALYVDSDCLMVRSGVSAYWESFESGCNTLGWIITSGKWKGLDIEAAIESLQLPHMIQMNAGVIFFDHSPLAANVFGYMRGLLADLPSCIAQIHQNRPGQYSMEPMLGAAMAKHGVKPMSILPGMGSLMVSTLYARRVTADFDRGVAYLEKPNVSSRYELFIPGRVTWTGHSPIFMHFIGLKPDAVYRRICARLDMGLGA